MSRDEERLARTAAPAREALRLHPFYRGKIQIMPKCAVRGLADFAVWYTPGVAASCEAVASAPELVWEHTNRGNTVAVVSDGTRILGLGDIGPCAGLPVMEGKALLFKYLGGVDAVPICLDTKDEREIARTVEVLQPSFGAVNLEDIAQPKCFRLLDRLRRSLSIPVWHDDQQGTATVVLAALKNALRLVGKDLTRVRIAMIGAGAANVATYRALVASGVAPAAIVACDRRGVLHPGREDVEAVQEEFTDKWRMCTESNGERVRGGVAEALRGTDVCIAFSTPGPAVIRPEWVATMARDAIVFACANPVPEIWPWQAREAGARIVATGRSDFPNQVNNSLGFPGIFRGVLDVRARAISDSMALAAADELARFAEERGLHEESILPRMDDWEVVPRIAVATAREAERSGLAGIVLDPRRHLVDATRRIREARAATEALLRCGAIAEPPPEPGARRST
jgi:malate dehydrogenase (oxaloacetate-decarboxylating)